MTDFDFLKLDMGSSKNEANKENFVFLELECHLEKKYRPKYLNDFDSNSSKASKQFLDAASKRF